MHLEQALVEHGALTLAGLKPASLFRFLLRDGLGFIRQFLSCRALLVRNGLTLTILKGCRRTGEYLLCLYRGRDLEAVLACEEHRRFLLDEIGYDPWADARDCLRQLAARLCLSQAFPHEVGVFLGYPLEDVVGFIANRGRNYTCCGCWKAYGDPEAARRRFDRYRRCTAICCERFRRGVQITRLIAA